MGLFNIGLSGIIASQYSLSVVGQNITNAGVEGYNRKDTLTEESMAGGRFNGVQIHGTRSMVNEFIDKELRNNVSSHARMETFFSQSTKLDEMLSNEDTSLINNINAFFTSIENVNADPASVQSREMLMNETSRMSEQFNSVANTLNDEYNITNFQLESYAEAITSLGSDIARINSELKNGQENFALEEKRENLLKDLSGYISIQAVKKDDNTVDVSISTGQMLVIDGDSADLITVPDPMDQNRNELAIHTDASDMIITGNIAGGKVGGVLAYRADILDQTRNEIGRLAMTISDEVNTQNQMGLNLKDSLGSMILKDINDANDASSRIVKNTNNTGSAQMSVFISDTTQLKASDYKFVMTNATDYRVLRLSDNTEVSTGTVGALPTQLAMDGFTLNIDSGTLNAGDSYRLMPTRYGASSIESVVSDVKDFAVASPVTTSVNQNNTGRAKISEGDVTDITNPSFAVPGQLSPPIRIEFLSDTSYQMVNATTSGVIEGPIAYDPAVDNELFPTPGAFDPGYRMTINGNAKSGDEFNIEYNSGGYNDNRNGLKMSAIQDKKLVNDKSQNIREAFSALTGTVSSKTNSAETGMIISDAIMSSTLTQRNQISGVNVDEEAANMVRYQQSFQASAQIISVARSMFDTLFGLLA